MDEQINVAGITIRWDVGQGTCTFEDLPVVMAWINSTFAGLMAGVQRMVGTERFQLALQSEGRNSVEDDWKIIARSETFEEGFKALSLIAAVGGLGTC